MSREQRRYPRYPVKLQVQYQDTDREVVISCNDVSLGGLFLSTATPPRSGTRVSLSIELPDGRGVVWATGHVVHLIPGRGMGIAFSNFGPGSRQRLEDFLISLA